MPVHIADAYKQQCAFNCQFCNTEILSLCSVTQVVFLITQSEQLNITTYPNIVSQNFLILKL